MTRISGLIVTWLGFTPVLVSGREQLRASFAAALGLAGTLICVLAFWGAEPDLPLLLPPLAASAVLIFAAPASPLAQPWNAIGGMVLSALAGIACARWIPWLPAAVACAPAVAILLMFMCRCLHPPGGAVALTAVLGGPAVKGLGFAFAFHPVGLQTVLLVVFGVAINRATGRRYPHGAPAVQRAAAGRTTEGGQVSAQVVREVLLRHDEVVDVDPEDLVTLIHEAGQQAAAQEERDVPCGALVTRDLPTALADTPVQEGISRMATGGAAFLAVLDADGRLLGAVAPLDLAQRPASPRSALVGGWARFRPQRLKDRVDAQWPFVLATAPASQAARLMAVSGRAWLPVVDGDRRFLGAVSHASLIRLIAGLGAADQRRAGTG